MGQEKPLPNESLVLERQDLATVRYLFLVPPPVFGPARDTVVDLMLAGCEAIRKGEGRTLEDGS